MGIDPPVYLLNSGARRDKVDINALFQRPPGGSTPLPEVLKRALEDHRQHAADRGLLLLVLTDGEANHMKKLNALLDAVQNEAYGDECFCSYCASFR